MKNHLLQARCWWLTPIIPATWKDDIRRIHVSRPVQAKSSQDLMSTNNSRKHKIGRSWLSTAWAKSKTLSPK
jgi:hypothetical protein